MSEQPILTGRVACTTTLYESPSYDAIKLGEFKEGSLFRLLTTQQENQVDWCKVETDDGKAGYVVGFFVEVRRECTIAQDDVPFYDGNKARVASLARGLAIRAWLPPQCQSDLSLGEDRNQNWIQVEWDSVSILTNYAELKTGYIRGIKNIRIPRLSRATSTAPKKPISFTEALPGLAVLLAIAALGIWILGKVIGMFLSSFLSVGAAYTISAVAVGTWFALKTLRRR